MVGSILFFFFGTLWLSGKLIQDDVALRRSKAATDAYVRQQQEFRARYYNVQREAEIREKILASHWYYSQHAHTLQQLVELKLADEGYFSFSRDGYKRDEFAHAEEVEARIQMLKPEFRLVKMREDNDASGRFDTLVPYGSFAYHTPLSAQHVVPR